MPLPLFSPQSQNYKPGRSILPPFAQIILSLLRTGAPSHIEKLLTAFLMSVEQHKSAKKEIPIAI